MVKVAIELSELEIEMLINCIDTAIDVKHLDEEHEKRAKEIKKQLSKYVPKCP